MAGVGGKFHFGTKAVIGLLILFCLILGIARSDFFSSTIGHRAKIHISFWNGWTGPDGRIALGIVRKFNEENPDVEVSMQRIAWALYYNKVMVSALDGRGPQVFVVHASAMTRMHHAGIIDTDDDLFEGKDAIPPGDFDKKVLNETIFGGKHYAVPLDIHPQGLYCNADMLKKIGMVNPDGSARPPQTRAEFLKAAEELTLPHGSDNPDQFGYALTIWQNNFQSLLPQFDGRYLDDNGRADLNCPNNIEALQFMCDLRNKLHVIPPPDNQLGWVGFRQQKVAMVTDGVYMLGDLERLNDFHYIGAPIPTIGNHPGTLADSHCLCIRTGISPAEREAAARFIRYLSAHSLEWAAAGQVPARISVRNQPAFKKMQVQYAFSKQIPWMEYPPRIVPLFEVVQEIQFAVEKAVRGTLTPKQALDIANQHAQQYIDRENANGSSP